MTADSFYQVIILGQPRYILTEIKTGLADRISDLGLPVEAIAFIDEANFAIWDRRLPTVGLFSGFTNAAAAAKSKPLALLLDDSNVVIPIVDQLTGASNNLPSEIQHINAIGLADDPTAKDRIISLILESFRLLRRERRVFISYKRSDSQPVANQLYDALDAHGFDVFIDSRSIPPAADFQAELWHRMSDSDVVVLLDTSNFRASRWTVKELATANATSVQILHLLWPGQQEDPFAAFSHYQHVKPSDFALSSASGQTVLTDDFVTSITREVEKLRARAMSHRHRYLVDYFCDSARSRGLKPNVQPHRWVSVPTPNGDELAVVPTIGIPTSDRINEVFDNVGAASSGTAGIWVLYDDRGVLDRWKQHLDWLGQHLPVRAVRVSDGDRALGDTFGD